MTGHDEVTDTLMNRVAVHIDEPLIFQFAIEQLGLTWEEVSVLYCYCEYEYVMKVISTERKITRNNRKIKEILLLLHSIVTFLRMFLN